MQAASDQQFTQLKQKFTQLDDDHDGFINKTQLQAFMKAEKLFKVQNWKVNEAMKQMSDKMSQEDFIIWIMGCRMGLQDWAQAKFKIANNIKNLKAAGHLANPSIKKSYLDISINKDQQSKDPFHKHYFNVKAGIDKQKDMKKRQQMKQVLGRDVAQIYLVLRFKAIAQGQKLAQKLNQLLQMGVAIASQLGPTVTPFIQSLTITSKWMNDYVYIILEMNNSFIKVLLKFFNQALQQLTPEGKFYLQTRISSDFSKVLKAAFNPLNQSINLSAQLQIGGISLTKLKEKIVDEFDKVYSSEDKTYMIFLFLLEEVNLALSFSNLKQCFESFGLKQSDIPKPEHFSGNIQAMQIKQMLAQFVPDPNQLLTIMSDYCRPQGQLSLHVSNCGIQISFNFQVQGAMELL